jgi:5-methylcytosine-specific restriction endonuclease McrA
MKRQISAAFKKAKHDMRARMIECHDCNDYATELHHIIAVEDGGTDDETNLMPLCNRCHKEYTSSQTIKRNEMWVELSIKDDGEVTARCKGEEAVISLGPVAKEPGD